MLKYIICGVLILLAGFVLFNKFGCHFPSFKPVVVQTDTTKPIEVSPTKIKYTPKDGTKPVIKSKPLESRPSIKPDGTLSIPQAGFVLIPKAGMVYVLHDKVNWAAGLRLAYWESAGLEALGNNERLFIGVDYRLPVLNLITVSAGASSLWTDITKPSPYIGATATLALH